jgi:hypothetical protein
MFRHPATIAERRAVKTAIEEGIKIRPSRNAKRLPNDYDDIQRCYTRCWKKYRLTQYRPVDHTLKWI